MASFQPLPGNAAGLAEYGGKYETIADRIAEVSTKLTNLARETGSHGASITQLAEKSISVSTEVGKAQKRYHETALAIVEFSVALETAQQHANSAISANSDGSSQLATLNYHKRQHEDDRLDAIQAGDTSGRVEELTTQIRRVENQISNVEWTISQAATNYNNAESERQAAVAVAIARISPVLDELNDSLGDRVRAAFDSVADFFQAIGKWVTEVLGPIIEAILNVIAAIVIILVIAIVVIAFLLAFGVIGMILALAVALVVGFLIGTILYEVVQGVLTPTPKMVPVELPAKSDESKLTPRVDDQGMLPPPANEQTDDIREDGYLDSLGGADSTIVEVIKVVGDDGVVRWRVILPSTQDWEIINGLPGGGPFDPKGDQGALGDLGSNIMLMLTPSQEAAYQRAVRDAMHQAGVGPHDPVMMVGWSQGGILAGRFAENTHDDFNVQAIFVGGSPIDAMNIPPTVDVISIQHTNDVVHKTDLTGPPPNSNHWYTVAADPYNGGSDHSSASYAATADSALAHPDPQLEYIHLKQQVFYQGTETVYAYQGSE